jgi:hypothetical protein
MLPNLLNHYQREWPGADFASYVADGVYMINGIEVPGETLVTLARTQIGTDGIIAILKSNPPIWARIDTASDSERKFRKFVDDCAPRAQRAERAQCV